MPELAELPGTQRESARVPITGPEHAVYFYEDDDFLCTAVAKFLADGIRDGDIMVVIATDAHAGAFRHRLEADGHDLASLAASGRITFLDAATTLSRFMRNGEPQAELFEREVGAVIAKQSAAAGAGRLRAYGEMVDVLWRDGRRSAALQLEHLWNDLQRRHAFKLQCAYAIGSFYKEPSDLNAVCAAHTHVGTGHAVGDAPELKSTLVPPQHTDRLIQEIRKREEVERALRECLQELRSKTDQLQRKADQLSDFIENASVGLHSVGADGTVLWANRAELELLGYSEQEYIGRPIADFHVDQPVIDDILARLKRNEELHGVEARLRAKDGSIKHVLISSNVYWRDGEFGHTRCFTRDITARKKLEDLRAAEAQRAQRLLQVTAAIADAVTAPQVFEALVDHLAAAVHASSASLWIADRSGGSAHLARAIGYPQSKQESFSTIRADIPSTPAADALRGGAPIWISSQQKLVRAYPSLAASVTQGRSYRVSCLPLVVHGRTLGVLGLTHEDDHEVSENERDFLLLVARYASQAIERLRLFDAEQRSRQLADAAAARMSVLSRASRAFGETGLELDLRLEAIVAGLGTSLQSSIGIALKRPDGRLHTAAVHHPIAEAQQLLRDLAIRAPVQMGEGVSGTVAVTGESVLIDAIDSAQMSARAAPAYRTFLERYPVHAMICAPLRVGSEIIGTVIATRTRQGETYDSEDLRLFEQLAERAASAIESCRLYQENSEARLRAERLYRFAQVVVMADAVEQVFEAALDAIQGVLGTDRAAILTFDGEGVMRFRAFRGLSEEYRRAVEGHSPWTRETVAPQPVLVSDVEVDPAMNAYLGVFQREGIGSLAFIPLVTRGELLGKFMIYYPQSHAYSAQEIELATAISNHVASVTARFAALGKLQETVHYNELFAGVLAHDLRNPLGAMMTAAQLVLMRQEGEGDRNQKPLARILSSGQRMTRMIDQLLDFTRARVGGGIEIHPREANLAELCVQAIGELELSNPEWNVQQNVVGDLNGSWDPDRLLQVISNLVANAGQHGETQHGIRIGLEGGDTDFVSLEIHNRGAIPQALLPVLFDPFRGTQYRRDQSRGLGLGLFIVREIIRGHAGTVDVTSSEANGTTFTIRLPRRAGAPRPIVSNR